MPRIFRAIGDEFNQQFNRQNAVSGNEFVGFNQRGEVIILTAALEAELPNISGL
jgi:hypothetical protein